MSVARAEENGVRASDILVLKRIQEKVLKASSFQTKNRYFFLDLSHQKINLTRR